MNRLVLIGLVLFLLLFVMCTPARVSESSVFGVFVGTSPCGQVSRRPLQIPATIDCEMIKWNLTLYQSRSTQASATYELSFTYGMSQPNTNGLKNGGTKVTRQGRWITTKGTKTDSQAVVYQLVADETGEPLTFVKLDQNLLHLLDSDKALAVGTSGWSYTLSRTETLRQTRAADTSTPSLPEKSSIRNVSSSGATTSSMLGRFVGRSPCRDVARELKKTVEPDCMKAKWEITLYHDSQTLAPTTYRLRGTFYRDQIKEGTWSMLRGATVNPEAVVYQLDADASQGALLLLKADDNILFFLDHSRNLMVGNGDFGYTLNRDK
jgi:hypothetical protein